jgi:hypothetical protein
VGFLATDSGGSLSVSQSVLQCGKTLDSLRTINFQGRSL